MTGEVKKDLTVTDHATGVTGRTQGANMYEAAREENAYRAALASKC